MSRRARVLTALAFMPLLAACSSLLDFHDSILVGDCDPAGPLEGCPDAGTLPRAEAGGALPPNDAGTGPDTGYPDASPLDATPGDAGPADVSTVASDTGAGDGSALDAADPAGSDASDCDRYPIHCGRCPVLCDGGDCTNVPSYRTDQLPFVGSTDRDAISIDANALFAIPVTLAFPACVVAIGFSSRSSGGESGYLGVYSSLNGQPSDQKVATGAVQAINGPQVKPVTSTFLPVGDYWIVGVFAQPLSLQSSTSADQTTALAVSSYPAAALPEPAPVMDVRRPTAATPLTYPVLSISTVTQ